MSQPARAASSPAEGLARGLDDVVRLRAEGRGREAIILCERLARSAPNHADAQHLLGILVFEAGDHRAALQSVERAIALDTRRADFFNSQGIICRALGERKRVIEAFQAALKLEPGLAEGHNNLGATFLESGAHHAATAEFREAIRLRPGYADAALNLARALAHGSDRAGEALELYRGLLAHPTLRRAAFDGAVELGARLPEQDLPDWLGTLLADRLKEAGAVTRPIERLAWRYALAQVKRPDAASSNRLLRSVLSRCLASSPAAEEAVLALRQRALVLAAERNSLDADECDDCAALALQAAASCHAQARQDGEVEILARLRTRIKSRIAAGERPDAGTLALYGVFAPLTDLEGADRLAQVPIESWPGSLQALLRRALIEPLIERAIAPKIPSLGPGDDQTSQRVRAQYEAHPYPRWIATETGATRPLGTLLRDHLPAADVPRSYDGPVDLLVAGCGTGWSVVHAALSLECAKVFGVDLSRASLAYGWREIATRKLENAVLIQGDILDLARLDNRFDYIVSGGVLHHMADPIAGWRALIDRLSPNGLMQIGLYSELGRRAVVAGRESIAAAGMPLGAAASDDAIRAFRQVVLAEPAGSAVEPLTRFADFYDLNGCRDLLFNEVEHRFDLPRLEGTLDRLGLEFLGFHLASPEIGRAYLRRFPDDPLMRSLANWHRFETENPDTFAAMYQFWCRRRATDSQTERASGGE